MADNTLTILQKCKNALRISLTTTMYDDEIQDLIDAAERDIAETGILLGDASDSLVRRAVVTYVKAHFGWNNSDAEKLEESYQRILRKMASLTDYVEDDNAVE